MSLATREAPALDSLEILLVALLLDRMFGEPGTLWSRIPHPVVLMGKVIGRTDDRLNSGEHRKLKGGAAAAGFVILALASGWLISALPDFGVAEVLVAFSLLAHKSLMEHVGRVSEGLEVSLEHARMQLAHIVGRDVDSLNRSGVARAAIESAAENFSDGVVAPVFWYCVLGLPGLLMYKFVNTADSMIGYRTERYREFGWAAARLDDILNYIPARLSGLLIALACLSGRAVRVMFRDAPLHRSPNAGWPEAALASVIDVALAGPRNYGGVSHDDPFINPHGSKNPGAADIDNALVVLNRCWLILFVILLVLIL